MSVVPSLLTEEPVRNSLLVVFSGLPAGVTRITGAGLTSRVTAHSLCVCTYACCWKHKLYISRATWGRASWSCEWTLYDVRAARTVFHNVPEALAAVGKNPPFPVAVRSYLIEIIVAKENTKPINSSSIYHSKYRAAKIYFIGRKILFTFVQSKVSQNLIPS